MRFNLTVVFVCASVLTVLACPAQAEVNYTMGIKMSHDDNVNGSPDSPTKANQQKDWYLTAYAYALYFTPLDDERTQYFIGQVGATTSGYLRYYDLNNTGLVASAGLWKKLSPTWSGQVTGRVFLRDTRQRERDSNGYGATLEIKKQLTETIWLKGVADYEDSKADLGTFSYTGKTYGLNLGYLPLKDTFINLGYSHNTRDFKGAVDFDTTSRTLFAEVTQRLKNDWYLSVGYAHGRNDSNIAGTTYTNDVISVGLSVSF